MHTYNCRKTILSEEFLYSKSWVTEYWNRILIPQTDYLFSLCNACKLLSIIPYRKVIGSTGETRILCLLIIEFESTLTVTTAVSDKHAATWKERVKMSKTEKVWEI